MNQILFAFYCNFWLSFAMLHVTCSLLLYKRQRHHTVFYSFCELVGLVYGFKLFLNVLHFSFKCLWRNWMEKKKLLKPRVLKSGWSLTYFFWCGSQHFTRTCICPSIWQTGRKRDKKQTKCFTKRHEPQCVSIVHRLHYVICMFFFFFFLSPVPLTHGLRFWLWHPVWCLCN